MAELRPASEMKNSGIEWVGQIPTDWRVVKNNRLFRISKELVGDEWENTQLLSLTKGGIIEKDINDGGGKQPESFSTYQFVSIDDIVLCLFDIDVSAVFSDRSSYAGMISPAYRVMKCEKNILPVYAKWWFDAVNVGRYYLIYTKSLRKTIDSEGFGNILTAIPSLSEQQAIADYLDDRCSKIDEIIAEATASIEEYKELKQAVIFEAVTKGLDKTVPMKESGIKSVGRIPTHWLVNKMNRICKVITDYVASGSFASLAENVTYLDNPDYAMLVRTADISGKSYAIKRVYISKESYDFLHNSNLFGGEIILPNIGASVGDVYMVPKLYEHMTLAPNAVMLRTNQIDDYYYFLFKCNAGRDLLIDIAQSTAQAKFNKTELRQLRLPQPPIEEQEQIVSYLSSRVNEIDALIDEKHKLVDDLQKYKKSLVYEVVTGKKRVVV